MFKKLTYATFLVAVLAVATVQLVLGQGEGTIEFSFSAYSANYVHNEILAHSRLADPGIPACWTIPANGSDDTNSQWGSLGGTEYKVAAGVKAGGACDVASRLCYVGTLAGLECKRSQPGHPAVSGVPSQYLATIWDTNGVGFDRTVRLNNRTGSDVRICWQIDEDAKKIRFWWGNEVTSSIVPPASEISERVEEVMIRIPAVESTPGGRLSIPEIVWGWVEQGWRELALLVSGAVVLALWTENRKLKRVLRSADLEIRFVGPPRRYRGFFLGIGAMVAWLAYSSQQEWLWRFVQILGTILIVSTIEIWWHKKRMAKNWMRLVPDWLGTIIKALALLLVLAYLGGWISVAWQAREITFKVEELLASEPEPAPLTISAPSSVNADAWRIIASATAEEPGCPTGLIYGLWDTETEVVNCQPYRNVGSRNPCLSFAGAQGPLQFMPGTWPTYAETTWDKWDLHDSARAACRMTQKLNLWGQPSRSAFQTRFAGYDGGLVWNNGSEGYAQAGEVWDIWKSLP